MGQLVVTPEVVASKINNMKENKSPGVDGLSPKILKETVEQMRQCPWIVSSEIMFVNYFWCKDFGRNHHDNVQYWINWQQKQCMKEVIINYSSAKMICIYISK